MSISGGGEFTIGADNGRIDTNDLDRDGTLDTSESTVCSSDLSRSTETFEDSQWIRVEFDISDRRDELRFVKQVRLTVRGTTTTASSGSFSIAKLEAVGNHWEAGTEVSEDEHFRVLEVNTFDNPDYKDESPEDLDIYEEIYDKVGGRETIREGSLELDYNLDGTTVAYAYMSFPSGLDFSSHEELKFLLKKAESGEDTDFFIDFGSGENFYRKKVKVEDFDEWGEILISLDEHDLSDKVYKGTPTITNINEIRLGVEDRHEQGIEGKVWVNVLHLSGSLKRVGTAERVDLTSEIPGILKYGGSYEHVSEDFQTITQPPENREITSYSANANLILLDFLPIRGRYSEREIVTPADRIKDEDANPYIRAREKGKVTKKDGSMDADLRISGIPDVGGRYSRSVERSDFSGRVENRETIRGNLSYSPPVDIFFIPKSLRGTARRSIRETSWDEEIIDKRGEEDEGGNEDWSEVTYDFSGRGTFDIFGLLDLRPSYSKIIKDRTWDFYTGDYAGEEKTWPWSRRHKADVDSTLILASWLRPSFSYSVDTNEDYNFTTKNGVQYFEEIKDIDRNFDIDSRLRFGVKNILPGFDPVETLDLDLSYGFEKGESYKNVDSDRSVFDKLMWSEEIDSDKIDSTTERDSRRYLADWRPFDFMSLSGDWLKAIGDMRLRTRFRRNQSKRLRENTIYEERSVTWPDFRADFGRLSHLPFTGESITNIDLRGEYSLNIDQDFSYTDGVDKDEDIHGVSRDVKNNYSINSRFRFQGRYDAFLDWSRETVEEKDLRPGTDPWDARQERVSYSGQVKFELKRYWDLIARFEHSRQQRVSYEDILRSDRRNYTPSLNLRAIIDLPDVLNVPILGDVSAGARMRLNADLKAEISRSELDVYETNTNKYTLNGRGELDVAANMRGSFGFGAQYVHNVERFANSYMGFHIQSEVTITF